MRKPPIRIGPRAGARPGSIASGLRNERSRLALSLALALAAAACSGPPEWTDRETLRPLQEEGGADPGPEAPAPGPGGEAPEIGLALPLTGPSAALGAAVRDGANLAFGEAGEGAPRPVVVDTASTDEGARKAVRDLAARPSTLAVLGPCGPGEAASASAAEEIGIPLLSAAPGAPEAGSRFAFRMPVEGGAEGAPPGFAERFQAAYGRLPGPSEAQGYDAARRLLGASRAGWRRGRSGVRDALAADGE